MGFQSYENPNFENFKTPKLGVSRQNGPCPMARHKEYYKGKVMASPKFELW